MRSKWDAYTSDAVDASLMSDYVVWRLFIGHHLFKVLLASLLKNMQGIANRKNLTAQKHAMYI